MDRADWIYVPDFDEERPWTGRIWSDGDNKTQWRFELIRHANIENLYDVSPFLDAAPVGGLIDHTQRCTLIRPLITKIDPGSLGGDYAFPRTRIEGICQALLVGLVVQDEAVEMVSGIGFESDAFAAWYGRSSFKTSKGDDRRTKRIETSPPQHENLVVGGLGEAHATITASINNDYSSSAVETRVYFRIKFDKPRSLKDSMDICLGLELLFGFLVGFRPRPPAFRLWQTTNSSAGDLPAPTGELHLSGVHWKSTTPPHPMDRLHRCGQGGVSLQNVLDAFAANPVDFVTRIFSVESGRFFATTLNDQFARVMPVFEEYIKARFNQADESDYLAKETAFFDWVDQASNRDIGDFCRKHVQVVERKSPSLPTQLQRAMTVLNEAGFRFASDLPRRISKRRASMFHSAPLMDEENVRSFSVETKAVTAMLLLHTFRDLGVPLAPLTEALRPLSDFAVFLAEPPRKD